MQHLINIPTSVTDVERDCNVVCSQMEPNVGRTTRRETAFQGTLSNPISTTNTNPELRCYFREYKLLL